MLKNILKYQHNIFNGILKFFFFMFKNSFFVSHWIYFWNIYDALLFIIIRSLISFFIFYFVVSNLKNELVLHEAVIKNDVEAVREIMKEPLDVNSRNNVSSLLQGKENLKFVGK